MILLLSLALASTPMVRAVHGWEDNHHFVVETAEVSHGDLDEETGDAELESLIYGDRYDVWGERYRTLVRHENAEPEDLPGPVNPDGWSTWLTERTFSNAQSTPHLDADRRVDIRAETDGEWSNGIWSDGDSNYDTITLGVRHTGGGWWPFQIEEQAGTAFGTSGRNVHVYPSPDGRWLAVYVRTFGVMTMRGPSLGDSKWTIHQVRPLVSVLAPEGEAAHARAVVEALDKPGNGQLEAGTAQAERDKTVVYFREGFHSDAQRMARDLGRRIAVEPMTWDGPQDVVIALGPPPAETP